MAQCSTLSPLPTSCFRYKKVLIFHPTNSKKGITTVGNLRVEIKIK